MPDNVEVRFWGTRGSIPTPGRHTEKYGGNTPCVEVRLADTVIVLDAGSGLRMLGEAWGRSGRAYPAEGNLLLSHRHWDHIQGFPFFSPAYNPGMRLTIYGAQNQEGDLEASFRGQMEGEYFPVPLAAMRARLEFRSVAEECRIGPFGIQSIGLPHPGGSLGYRLEGAGQSLVFMTDCELERVRSSTGGGFPPALVEFVRGVDLLIIDCQYTDDVYPHRRGWGHNGLQTVVDFVLETRPTMAALFHHDPQNGDVAVQQMEETFRDRLRSWGLGVRGFAAREGAVIALRSATAQLRTR